MKNVEQQETELQGESGKTKMISGSEVSSFIANIIARLKMVKSLLDQSLEDVEEENLTLAAHSLICSLYKDLLTMELEVREGKIRYFDPIEGLTAEEENEE